LLRRAARCKAARRGAGLPHLRDELEEIGRRRRADRRSRPPRRLSRRRRFTTVYKFALLETAAKLRKRAWQGREVPLEPDAWNLFESVGLAPAERVEQSELLSTWRRRSVNC
jgi:RNA polymerase sigma-70 factor (ECF subfamily)